MILVFSGNPADDVHAKNFVKGNQYTISDIIEYDIDSDSIYGGYNVALSFEGNDYGCFTEFADRNFLILNDYRNKKIDNILE